MVLTEICRATKAVSPKHLLQKPLVAVTFLGMYSVFMLKVFYRRYNILCLGCACTLTLSIQKKCDRRLSSASRKDGPLVVTEPDSRGWLLWAHQQTRRWLLLLLVLCSSTGELLRDSYQIFRA